MGNLLKLVSELNETAKTKPKTITAPITEKREIKGKEIMAFDIGGETVIVEGTKDDAIRHALKKAKEIEKKNGKPVFSIKPLF